MSPGRNTARKAQGFFLRALALLLGCLVAAPAPARAQTDIASPSVQLVLVDQPLWHEPGDPLGIQLQVVNEGTEPVEGVLIRVAAHQRADTRSGLAGAFGGPPGFEASAFTDESLGDREIEPGSSVTVSLEGGVDTLSSLAAAPPGGVYPVTISLFDAAGGALLDSFTTALIFYPRVVDTPLDVVVVVPLNSIPNRGPDGLFSPSAGTPSLETGVSDRGWLTAVVDAIDASANPPAPPPVRGRGRARERPQPVQRLRIGLAPTPRLVEELADMADGYRRDTGDGFTEVGAGEEVPRRARELLDRLSDLLHAKGVQPLLSPYSFPDLPALVRNLPFEDVSAEITEGQSIAAENLGVELDGRWLLPPASRLDLSTLDALQGLGPDTAQRTFFSSAVLESAGEPGSSGCPEAFATFTCPVRVTTAQGTTRGYVSDPTLQQRLAALGQPGDNALDLQRFFAETAVIREELPSVGGRLIQITVPSLWHPGFRVASAFYRGLVTAPWLTTITPTQGLHDRQAPRPRSLVSSLEPLAGEPDPAFFDEIASTQDLVTSFKGIRPPVDMVQRMTRNTLVAQSRLWWRDPVMEVLGTTYVRDTVDELERVVSRISVTGLDEISLTSERGEIPVVVSNDSDFDVAVAVRVVATQLDFEEDRFQFTVEPHSVHQLTARARVRSSGAFPLKVILETPDGSFEIASKSVTIRSTEFNVIALTITIGALAFLVFFYLARAVRARRRAGEGTPA